MRTSDVETIEAGRLTKARLIDMVFPRADEARVPPVIREYRLRLQAVRFRANIGASAAERSIPQDLVVDVDLELPVAALAKRDTKREVVDYDLVVRLVVDVGLAEPYRLLEIYAQRLLERLLAETPALRVRVAVTKLRVPSTYSTDKAVVELVGTREG